MTERLTTLQAVKDWLGITTDTTDAQLIRVIDAASQFALNYMSRASLQAMTYTMNFRGNGKEQQLIRQWPVISITSLSICGRSIPAATISPTGLPSNGYFLNVDDRAAPPSLELYNFCYQLYAPCQVVYLAGYQTTNPYTFAANTGYNTYAPQNSGQWTQDLGVTLNGVPMVLVTTETPAEGQYYVDAWGNYTFNDADAEQSIVISYSYAPWDIAFGVTEIIGEWYKRKDRIGQLSKSLGGQETVSFTNADMNDAVKSMIQPYRNVVPV